MRAAATPQVLDFPSFGPQSERPSVRTTSIAAPLSEAAGRVPTGLGRIPMAERFNVWSHLAGSILMALATITLVDVAAQCGSMLVTSGFAAYGIGLFLTFLSSAAYHASSGRTRVRLRRYDRAAINVAIAGGQTPIVLLALPFPLALTVLGAFWGLALIGVSRELRPGHGSERRSIVLYLLNGWGILLFQGHLAAAISFAGIGWLLSSGALFTAGAVIMSCRFVPRNHEIWHVLVLAGTACHCLAVFGLLG